MVHNSKERKNCINLMPLSSFFCETLVSLSTFLFIGRRPNLGKLIGLRKVKRALSTDKSSGSKI